MVYRVPDPQRSAEVSSEEARAHDADREVIAAMKRSPALPGMRWAHALLAFVVAGLMSLPLLFLLAVTVSPARSDEHPVMPIGQAGFALVFAPVLGAVSAWLVGRRRT